MECSLMCDYVSGEREIVEIIEYGQCLKLKDKDLDLLLNYKSMPIDNEDVLPETKTLTDDVDIFGDDVFCYGWYCIEDVDGRPFRWSKPLSYINLTGLEGYTLTLTIATNNPVLIDHDVVVFFVDATTKDKLGSVRFSAGRSTTSLTLHVDNSNLVIMLVCDSMWIPAVIDPESNDWRELSFAVENVTLISKGIMDE